ncbi:MAG: CerR family C-terminal domain-containing protein [Aureliella sp.]
MATEPGTSNIEPTRNRSVGVTLPASVGGNEASAAERLISAAGEIFAAKGQHATVREICKAAGCSVAAINYHFGDKNQLYLTCVRTACERKQRLFPMPNVEEGSEPEALLRKFLRTIAQRMAAKSNVSWHNTLMLREVVSPSEGVAEFLSEAFRRDFAILLEIIGKLLGPEADSEARRQEFAVQILARCMFLRTGQNLLKILSIDQEMSSNPEQYADIVCDSMLHQFAFLAGQSSNSN